MKQLILVSLSILYIQTYCITQTICGDITAQDIEVIDYNCQEGTVSFCIPLRNLNNYEISINDELQTDFIPCGELQTIVNYSYADIENSNSQIILEKWQINDISFFANLQNIQELVDSMNVWDAPVKWELNETYRVIISSNSNNNYSDMELAVMLNNGAVVPAYLGVNLASYRNSSQVETAIQESFSFKIVNNLENCEDEILIDNVATSSQVDCQNFAPKGATWYYQDYTVNGDKTRFIKVESARDTNIVKLANSKALVSILEVSNNDTNIPEGRTFIREAGDKVYFYEDDEFKLIYDFTMNVGDTALVNIPKNRTYFDFNCSDEGPVDESRQTKVIVDSISYIENQGQKLKVLHTRPDYDDYDYYYYYGNPCFEFGKITERLGSEYGLFGRDCTQCLAGFPGEVRCYSDHLVDVKLVEEDCDFGINTATNNLTNHTVNIYPNPVYDQLNIETKADIERIKIIDLGGRTILHQPYIVGNSIDMNKIQSGFYFIELLDKKGNRIYIEKIVRM